MGTMNGMYISKDTSGEIPEVDHQQVDDNERWIGLILADDAFECDEAMLKKVSESHGTAIFMCFQSTVDAFQFIFAHNGTIKRKLIYGCFEAEREWEVVEGTSLYWENDVLKNDELAKNGLNAFLDSRETCRSIAAQYGFPGW